MQELKCVVCEYKDDVEPEDVQPAHTVIDGFAVCQDHQPLAAQGDQWRDLMARVRGAQGQ